MKKWLICVLVMLCMFSVQVMGATARTIYRLPNKTMYWYSTMKFSGWIANGSGAPVNVSYYFNIYPNEDDTIIDVDYNGNPICHRHSN